MRLKWPIADIVGLKKTESLSKQVNRYTCLARRDLQYHSEGRLALHVS